MNVLRNAPSLLAAAIGLLLAGEVAAQTMFRCGNKYQDRPCDPGQAGKATPISTGGRAAPASGGADADCSRLGQDAAKVVWAWEGGATPASQIEEVNRNAGLSDAQKQTARKLVSDVYRQRGTAGQVSARIESECVAEKEERARQKALADALIKSGVRPEPAPAAAPAAPPVAQGQSSADIEAAQRKRRCAELNAQQESIRNQQRSGGSPQAMDRLRDSYNNITRELSNNRC